jgi:mono/diheme cytochrome c family protein
MIHEFSTGPFFKSRGWLSISLTLILILLFFPLKVQAADTLISGTVRGADGGSLNGLVLIEKGRLYNKNFRYGGLVRNGRFSVKVDSGGAYGLHLYATGYVYFPLGIRVENGKDNQGQYKLPPNPASDRAPVLKNIKFTNEKNGARIALEVSDPNHDLSHQVLALNASTGEGFRMDPPGLVLPFTKTYPEGTYSLQYSSFEEIKPKNWYFVAADNKCYNSPVLGSPFSAEGIMPAKTAWVGGAESSIESQDSEVGDKESAVSGLTVFTNNCSMCHFADSDKSKVGPGLKGLYMLEKTPALGNPLTDDVIRKQILEGGESMPPYSHLTEGEVRAVMEYLKML